MENNMNIKEEGNFFKVTGKIVDEIRRKDEDF